MSQQERIQQRLKEARTSWEMLNRRIEAAKRDLALELDGQRKVVLQMRIGELEKERSELETELSRLEGDVQLSHPAARSLASDGQRTLGNPYNYHLPVQDDAMFWGRADLLARLGDGLAQPRPLSAAVFGGRRCGKTSLLRKLERDMLAGKLVAGDRPLIPWYYDPQAGYPVASGDDFFLLALEALHGALPEVPLSAEEVRQAYGQSLRLGPANAFAEGFRLIVGQAGRRLRLVLLIDEADALLAAPWGSNLRPNLRNLLSNSAVADSLALVMAGAAAFHAQVTEKDSPLENILTRYSLANLTRGDTIALARVPNQERLSLAAAEEVWVQTGGHPCLAQFILYELWDDIAQATPEDVRDVAAEFSSQVDHLERWSAALSALAHDVYGGLSEQSAPLRYTDIRRQFPAADGGELQHALDALIYHGLVNITGRGRQAQYSIAGVMFRDWYRNDRPRQAPTVPHPVEAVSPPVSACPVYETFDLEIERHGPDRYEVQVLDAPTGPVRGPEVALNLADAPFQAMLNRIQAGDVDAALLSEVGQRLHAFLFPAPVLTAYLSSREAARAHDKGLCIKLRLHHPELVALPWELLYNPHDQSFCALSVRTPLVRFLPGVLESPLPPVLPPWRLLLVTASPSDLPALAIEQERAAILDAVHPLVDAGKMTVQHLDHATPVSLLAALRQGAHWLHFVGHGEYNSQTGQGALILEQEEGRSTRMDVDTLRYLLPEIYEQADARLRLVFLNACATAQVGMLPGTRGLAQTLAQAGIPATIGMSRPVVDRSARAFSRGFYEALAQNGWPLQAAVSEGRRRAMLEGGLHSGDWAVPVVFVRDV